MLKLQRKIYHANQALAYFILNVWVFKNRNLYSLHEGLHESDITSFQFDYEVPDIDVLEYFGMAIYGWVLLIWGHGYGSDRLVGVLTTTCSYSPSSFSARKYLIREKDEDLPMARIKFRRMYVYNPRGITSGLSPPLVCGPPPLAGPLECATCYASTDWLFVLSPPSPYRSM